MFVYFAFHFIWMALTHKPWVDGRFARTIVLKPFAICTIFSRLYLKCHVLFIAFCLKFVLLILCAKAYGHLIRKRTKRPKIKIKWKRRIFKHTVKIKLILLQCHRSNIFKIYSHMSVLVCICVCMQSKTFKIQPNLTSFHLRKKHQKYSMIFRR